MEDIWKYVHKRFVNVRFIAMFLVCRSIIINNGFSTIFSSRFTCGHIKTLYTSYNYFTNFRCDGIFKNECFSLAHHRWSKFSIPKCIISITQVNLNIFLLLINYFLVFHFIVICNHRLICLKSRRCLRPIFGNLYAFRNKKNYRVWSSSRHTCYTRVWFTRWFCKIMKKHFSRTKIITFRIRYPRSYSIMGKRNTRIFNEVW